MKFAILNGGTIPSSEELMISTGSFASYILLGCRDALPTAGWRA
jgi:hypothetical protein